MLRASPLLLLLVAACARPDPNRPIHPTAGIEISNDRPAPAEAPDRLRVVSFNVARGANIPKLARKIFDSDILREADVFLIQEIESHADEETSRARQLADALRFNYTYVPARPAGEAGSHGLAIMSRWPLSDVEAIQLPRMDMTLRPRRRIAVAATIDVRGRPVHFYNVHLDTRINTRRRLAQLKPVFEAAAANHDNVVVIGGDLNTNPVRWAANVLPTWRSRQADAVDEAMEREGFAAPLADQGATHKTGPVRLRLDGLFARGAAVADAGVERSVNASDHWPIWVDLTWTDTD